MRIPAARRFPFLRNSETDITEKSAARGAPEADNCTGKEAGASALFDAAQLVLERGFDAGGAAFAASDAADVGAVDPELARDTSVQPAVKAVSLQHRIFAMISRHQR